MTVRSRIIGCGSYLPSNVVTNDELAKRVDTSDEWIVARTGIRQRHIAAEGETTSDLAVAAATRAMEHAGVTAADIDMIIVATATPDNTFPATATKVQHRLGVVGFAFDVQAVCSGFVYALTTADMYIRNGQAKTVLVIGAETFSRILDWEDRRTCVLFGDGAGAVVVQAVEGKGTVEDQGILASRLHSDGGKYELLYVNGGPSTTQTVGFLQMEGKEVFRHAVTNLAGVIREVLADTGLEAADIDWLVPHQANRRILDSTARKFGISEDKVVITVDRHANTSAASIPLALAEAVHDGRIKRGDIVILEAMGGGFTWGAALIRW
ncbi:beta-ketoacyl-ACP synthase III [Thalassospira xiamenensis]|uniref:beta-ketoacyl-ACP synthase III n=1 Tax=Thalassospira xiamenensis TaxID=220697 RepID=UPI000DEDE10D|nr:beta-ketoacyl-ACP synthase III [Thalassospira xiamenensis]RCK42867.1 3-oxoacyl-ACP synthase [Thalassospira xiamenensis]